MSPAIPPAALIRGAARLATEVAGRVGQAIGFDEVLRSQVEGDQPSVVSSLKNQLVEAIGKRLAGSGIAVNQPLKLSVTLEGRFRVEGPHPRSGEIESLLNSDEGLVEQARELGEVGRNGSVLEGDLTIDLTIPGTAANILGAPGGYANW